MLNKYEELFRLASMIDIKVDFSVIQEISNKVLSEQVGFDMSDKFILYSDNESYSIGLELLENRLSEKEIEDLGSFNINEDFLNMELVFYRYFSDLSIEPHSISINALDNDDAPYTPCEIVISK